LDLSVLPQLSLRSLCPILENTSIFNPFRKFRVGDKFAVKGGRTRPEDLKQHRIDEKNKFKKNRNVNKKNKNDGW
jgi:hypothetical protein